MHRSTRGTVAVGLCLVGVAGLVGRSFGQQDGAVRKVAAPNAAALAPAAPIPVSIGSIDMDGVLKNYDKFKVATETLRSEALARHNDLMKVANEAKSQQEQLSRMAPNGPDAKKCEERFTQLKAQLEAGRENAEREFQQKEAETMATIYNDIQGMAKGVAKQRGYTFIVKYTDQAAAGSEPNSVMAAMSRTVLYADAKVDITNEVTHWLNQRYKTMGGTAPKAAPGASPAGPAARPAAGPGGN